MKYLNVGVTRLLHPETGRWIEPGDTFNTGKEFPPAVLKAWRVARAVRPKPAPKPKKGGER